MFNNSVKLWSVEGLDLRRPMQQAGLADQTIYGEWVVSTVIRRAGLKHGDDQGFTEVTRQHFTAVVPKNVLSKVKRALLGSVIECDDEFRFGIADGKCLGYRLTPEWAAGEVVRIVRQSIHVSKKLAVRRAALRRLRQADVEKLSGVDAALHAHMMGCSLVRGDEDHPIYDHLGEGTDIADRWFKRCAQRRLHHAVACCPRRLRPLLRFSGWSEPNAMLDVKACQPTLMGLLIRDSEELHRPVELPPTEMDRIRSITLMKTKRRTACPKRDAERYVDLCLSTDFYDFLAKEMTDMDVADREYSRQDAKDLWPATLFDCPKKLPNTRVGRVLVKHFPGFVHAVRSFGFRNGLSALARRLQRMESDVMIDLAANSFVVEQPHIPLVTIHDAVIVPASASEAVGQAVRSAWKSRFGVSPRLDTSVLA